jgi:tetratricopeptide (TPR) repeat protein
MNEEARRATEAFRQLEVLAGMGRWEEVGRRLGDWRKQRPDDPRGVLLRGIVLLETGRTEEGKAELARIRPGVAEYGRAQTLLGEVALRRMRAPEAIAHFEAAAKEDGRALPPRQKLIALYNLEQRVGETRDVLWELFGITRDPRVLVDLVLELWAVEGDVRIAGSELEAYVGQTPEDPFLRRAWGLALHGRGQSAEALPHLEYAAAELGDDPVGRLALAECRHLTGAGGVTPELLGPEPGGGADAARWWIIRGRIQELQGETAGARASYQRAVERNPASVEGHYRLSQLLARTGDPAGAERVSERMRAVRDAQNRVRKLFERVRKQGFPRDAEQFVIFGEECERIGLMREARAWFELAAEVEPGRSGLRERLVDLERSAGRAVFPFALPRPIRRARSVEEFRSIQVAEPQIRTKETPIAFESVAREWGLEYRYDAGASDRLHLADTMGGGVALWDYDQDGRLDLYFINGCPLPVDSSRVAAPNRLYRNLGGGRFEDVTARAGVGGAGYGMGAAVGDYDGDGDPDLFVTGLHRTILYRNRGDGTFEDVTEAAGVFSHCWTTAAGFADLDGDGDLDLAVVTYVEVDPEKERACQDHSGGPIHCSPSSYPAQADLLFRNDGNGRFTDVSGESGISSALNGRGLGMAIADWDEDGMLDIYVANDASPDFLFRNKGGMQFEEVGTTSGLAYNGEGLATASMGVAAEDLDGDGHLDLFITNFLNEPNTWFRNLGGGLFADSGLGANLATPSRPVTGFGVGAVDLDRDGRMDLVIANGHVDDQPWVNSPMAQPALVHRGRGVESFELIPGTVVTANPIVGRGLALGDLDDDGRVDLVIVRRDGPALVLRNTTPGGEGFGVRLQGRRSGNPAVGTRLILETERGIQHRWVTSGTSYLSVHDSRVWFGIAPGDRVRSLEVIWPSGSREKRENPLMDRVIEMVEGEDSAAARQKRNGIDGTCAAGNETNRR